MTGGDMTLGNFLTREDVVGRDLEVQIMGITLKGKIVKISMMAEFFTIEMESVFVLGDGYWQERATYSRLFRFKPIILSQVLQGRTVKIQDFGEITFSPKPLAEKIHLGFETVQLARANV